MCSIEIMLTSRYWLSIRFAVLVHFLVQRRLIRFDLINFKLIVILHFFVDWDVDVIIFSSWWIFSFRFWDSFDLFFPDLQFDLAVLNVGII